MCAQNMRQGKFSKIDLKANLDNIQFLYIN